MAGVFILVSIFSSICDPALLLGRRPDPRLGVAHAAPKENVPRALICNAKSLLHRHLSCRICPLFPNVIFRKHFLLQGLPIFTSNQRTLLRCRISDSRRRFHPPYFRCVSGKPGVEGPGGRGCGRPGLQRKTTGRLRCAVGFAARPIEHLFLPEGERKNHVYSGIIADKGYLCQENFRYIEILFFNPCCVGMS